MFCALILIEYDNKIVVEYEVENNNFLVFVRQNVSINEIPQYNGIGGRRFWCTHPN